MVTSLTNKKKFEHSVNVLLKAYLNNELEHSNCIACAVGNLIRDSMGISCSYWSNVFMSAFGVQRININEYTGLAKIQIDSTGYTWKELAKIEFAFENANVGKSEDDYMFNGLMDVIDVLADIHEIDLSTVKETKELFV